MLQLRVKEASILCSSQESCWLTCVTGDNLGLAGYIWYEQRYCCKSSFSIFAQPAQWLCFMWDVACTPVLYLSVPHQNYFTFVSEGKIVVPVFLPCVSSSQQYHSKQSIGIWLEGFVSNYPPYSRSHGSTRPDSWQTKHSVWVYRWQWKVSWMIHLAS